MEMSNHNKRGKSYYLHIPSEYQDFFFGLARDRADEEECSLSEIVTRTFVDGALPRDKNMRRYALIPYTGGSVIDAVRQVLNDSWLAQSAPLGKTALNFAERYFPLKSWICPGRDTGAVLDNSFIVRENVLQLLASGELSARESDACHKLLPLLNGPVTLDVADAVFSWLHYTYARLSPKVQPTACGIAAMILSGVCSLLGPAPSDYDDCDDRLAWCCLLCDIESKNNNSQHIA